MFFRRKRIKPQEGELDKILILLSAIEQVPKSKIRIKN